MHCAALQYDIAWENKGLNHTRMGSMLSDAGLPAGSFVVTPELGDTGFSFNLERIVDDASEVWAGLTARTHQIYIQAGFARRGGGGKGLNCAGLFNDRGELVGTYEKVHPFSFGREIEHFCGGNSLLICEVLGVKVCPMICYDLRFPELWRLGAMAGAEVFTIGASWPASRQQHWRSLLIARAIENQAYVVGCNRIGDDPHLSYAGGSMIVSPRGEVLAEGGSDNACVLRAVLDIPSLRAWRKEFGALEDIRRSLLGEIRIERRG